MIKRERVKILDLKNANNDSKPDKGKDLCTDKNNMGIYYYV